MPASLEHPDYPHLTGTAVSTFMVGLARRWTKRGERSSIAKARGFGRMILQTSEV
jgi:hypothetical protein